MKNLIFTFILLGLLTVQCKNQKTVTMTQPVREIINTNTFVSQVAEPDFTIKTARLEGDVLKMTVHFAGEKGNHDFDLLWDGSMMKSMPPKVLLTPVHKSKNHSGKKLVDMELEFNVSTVGKPGGHNSVIIMIKDFSENFTWQNK